MISPLWILAPIISVAAYYGGTIYIFVSIFNSFVAAATAASASPTPPSIFPSSLNFNLASLIIIVPSLLLLYLFYRLIKRRNQHFERQNRLFRNLSVAARKVALARSISGTNIYLNYIDNWLVFQQSQEEEKSAVFLAILLIIPILNVFAFFYILHFLTKDFYAHEQRENYMLGAFSSAFLLMGVNFSFRREHPIPERSFALYFVLALVTLGIFSFYWDYTLIKDPNGHFEDQNKFEASLLPSVTPMAISSA